MGLLLSVLFSYVGGLELAYAIRDVVHQVCLHDNCSDRDDTLKKYQDRLRSSIQEAIEFESESLQRMQDGVLYENGYRVADLNANFEDQLNYDQNQDHESEIIGENVKRNDDYNDYDVKNQWNSSVSDNATKRSTDDILINERSNEKNNSMIQQQTNEKPLTKPMSNKPQSEDSTSYEPQSQSSTSLDMPDVYFEEYENTQGTAEPYSEEYLRSLDGVKFRPLVRDDGTGRRRAFKKRQQSSSSTSSGEAARRFSREEELKMFTSLEEEEFESMKNSDYTPIQYSSEPNLKVKRHSRRHKRSPVRNSNNADEPGFNQSCEINNEQSFEETEPINPWGEVDPSHFHDTELWHRERANSIAEEPTEDSKIITNKAKENSARSSTKNQDQTDARHCFSPVGNKLPKTSSFEDANDTQNILAINNLQKQNSNENDNEVNNNNKVNKNVSNEDVSIALAENEMLNNFAAITNLSQNQDSPEMDLDSQDADLDDDKIQEFILRIEALEQNVTDKDCEEDKFQFKEFLESPHRLRHPSYNFDAGDVKHYLNEENSRLSPDAFQSNASVSKMESNVVYRTQAFISAEIDAEELVSEGKKNFQTVEKVFNVNRQESNFSTISNESGSEFNPGKSSLSGIHYRDHSPNASIKRPDSYDDLEYIKTRDIPVIGIKDEVDSDNYHHMRRFSETAENLEYIRGREDWMLFMESQLITETKKRNRLTISIQEEIDSDEYHHVRRLSEALDLSVYAYSKDGQIFITQGSPKNGRDRSPYKLMKIEDVEKDEFLRKYYWKGNSPKSRSVSENRDVAEEDMIQRERLHWMRSSLGNKEDEENLDDATEETSGSDDDRITVVEASSNIVASDLNDDDIIGIEDDNDEVIEIKSELNDSLSIPDVELKESQSLIDVTKLEKMDDILPIFSQHTSLKKSKRIGNLLEAEQKDSFDLSLSSTSIKEESKQQNKESLDSTDTDQNQNVITGRNSTKSSDFLANERFAIESNSILRNENTFNSESRKNVEAQQKDSINLSSSSKSHIKEESKQQIPDNNNTDRCKTVDVPNTCSAKSSDFLAKERIAMANETDPKVADVKNTLNSEATKIKRKLNEKRISRSGIEELIKDSSFSPWFHK